MLKRELLARGQELGVIAVDETADTVTYRLAREKRYRWSDPEEKVRAEMLVSLVFEYQYSPGRIDTEVTIPNRSPNNWADIVVFKDDRLTSPYITVETASPDVSQVDQLQKAEQLFGYANALASEFAVYYDAATKICWRVRGFGGLERSRNVIPDVPANYGETPEYIYVRAGENDLREISIAALSQIFQRCHNELWSGGRLDPTEAFDEMSKLMFAKLYDERQTRNGAAYGFQWGDRETEFMVAQRVLDQYENACDDDSGLFTDGIGSEPRKIAAVVRLLQHVSLDRTDPDAKGRAFEQFLGEIFRGRLGQYFTRREIVDFMVSITKPTNNSAILDPACGSGGFLVYSMKQVFSQIEAAYAGDERTIFRLKDNFAKRNLYGIEINEKIARVAMMDMVINEDGHTNIEIGSGLDSDFDNSVIANDSFTHILTNPPFGDSIRSNEADKLGQAQLSGYQLAKGKQSAKSEVLFIERCTQFLRQGGMLGMVVPDGILSNPSDRHVRGYILSNYRISAIISLPSYAFRKAGSGMKTSMLIAKKWEPGDNRTADYPVFLASANHIGYDATGRPDSNDLPVLLENFTNGTGAIENGITRVSIKSITNSGRLDPQYYILEPIIEREFDNIPFPTTELNQLVSQAIQSGKSPKGGAKYSIGDIPILLVGNITVDGSINLDDLSYVDEDFFSGNQEKGGINPLDILIAKDGATTGKIGLVPEDFVLDRCLINEHIFKLTVKAEFPGDEEYPLEGMAERVRINTYYLFFFLKSWLGQQQIVREISGGAQGGITRKFVENIRVPIPPIEQRRNIVQMAQQEYGRYINLTEQAREQYQHFEASLSQQMRNR